VIVALTIPLGMNLSRRAEAEFKIETLVTAQTLAALIGRENIDRPQQLKNIVEASTPPEIERVVVVDGGGVATYDSEGIAAGSQFATSLRPEMEPALSGDPVAEVRYSETLGHNIMVAAAPVIDESIVGAIRLTRDFGDVDAAVKRTYLGLVGIGAVALAAGILIAFGLSSSMTQPIRRLADAARRLGRGDLSARTGEVNGAAEVKELAGSFDEMADRLERTMQAQREFVANASHQLRTPLTAMKLRLESAVTDAPSDEVRHQLEAAEREVDRLSTIVDRLLLMSHEIEEGAQTHVDLQEAAGAAAQRVWDRATREGRAIAVRGTESIAQANPTDVGQIIDNLLDNALSYGAGAIDMETGTSDRQAWVTVRDHGPGIPPQEQERVIERFYRGKGTSPGGSGLGLAIARELTEKWGGSMTVGSAEGGGALVTARFRLVRTASTDVLKEQAATRP
jgi:signal transduction histidine kinase